MTDGHPPPTPQTAGDGPSPFDPFMLEPQKAHNSTGSPAPPPMQRGRRRMRIPGPLLGLLLALAVAVPTVVATLQPAGQDSSGEAGGGVSSQPQDDAQSTTESPPPSSDRIPRDHTPAPPADPPSTAPGPELLAIEDCVESLPGLRGSCETLLGQDSQAAARYLDCRGLGLPADRCLVAAPTE
jgi:hypothetical protein